MINPMFKIKTETTQSGFNFADLVVFDCLIKGIRLKNHTFQATVTGKVKNANAYVINVCNLDRFNTEEQKDRCRDYIINLKEKYGYPIRQIELEWGKFSGSIAEFIVPDFELTKPKV